jgi:hypothetical protein
MLRGFELAFELLFFVELHGCINRQALDVDAEIAKDARADQGHHFVGQFWLALGQGFEATGGEEGASHITIGHIAGIALCRHKQSVGAKNTARHFHIGDYWRPPIGQGDLHGHIAFQQKKAWRFGQRIAKSGEERAVLPLLIMRCIGNQSSLFLGELRKRDLLRLREKMLDAELMQDGIGGHGLSIAQTCSIGSGVFTTECPAFLYADQNEKPARFSPAGFEKEKKALLRSQANRAIQANGFAIEQIVVKNMQSEFGVVLRCAQA